MKKIKSLFCMLILSTCLVGNVFAGDFATYGVLSFFDSIINVVIVASNRDGGCEGRICTNCKPGSDSESGNCRPTD